MIRLDLEFKQPFRAWTSLSNTATNGHYLSVQWRCGDSLRLRLHRIDGPAFAWDSNNCNFKQRWVTGKRIW